MYDEQLAEEILAKLAAAYPAKLRFADLRSSLPSYRSADDRALLATIEALDAEGRATCVGLRDGFSGRLTVAENIALSATEWEARRPPRPTDPYPDSAEEILKQIDYWASRQGEGDPDSRWGVQVRDRLKQLRFQAQKGAAARVLSGSDESRDTVTEIYDRAQFDRDLPRILAEGESGSVPLSLAMADLDKFKAVNDGQGHQAGDRALRTAARAIAAACAGKGRVYRYGGDEFVVLFPNFEEAEAAPVAERARRAVKRDCGGKITVSVGVASLQPSADAASLLKAADDAMYAAKGAGGNRVEFARRAAGGGEAAPT